MVSPERALGWQAAARVSPKLQRLDVRRVESVDNKFPYIGGDNRGENKHLTVVRASCDHGS